MAKFQKFALDPEFRPVSSFDTASRQAQYAKEQVAQLQEFMNSRRVTDQQAIEDARFSGQNFNLSLSFFAEYIIFIFLDQQFFRKKLV